MNEDFLLDQEWQSTWDSKSWILGNLLLWLPNDCDYTLITSVNNYADIRFKGIIETEEEFITIIKILKKGTIIEQICE